MTETKHLHVKHGELLKGWELIFEIMQKIIESILDKCQKENPCSVKVSYNEPMSEHTTFRVGGFADVYLRINGDNFPGFSAALLRLARLSGIPVFFLGGGANIVVSDNGIRGIVLDTCDWKGITVSDEGFICRSGTSLDEASDHAAALGLSGLEFFAGMPGTIGGAVWMNARCYGSETSDVLSWTEILEDKEGRERVTVRVETKKELFGYKSTPFQQKECLIISACFNLKPGDKDKIKIDMEKNRQDRQAKGHYLFPCAGSVFKNNRKFGKPTGQLIDELGLKGYSSGAAQIAPFHGNIIINTGGATASDIRSLADEVAAKVKAATGFILEPEIIFVGD
jgi:UDP-N-acetylmuramate dehydrogenase